MKDFARRWERAATGELCWLGADGPTGVPVVPLTREGRPCVAFPLSRLSEVDDVEGRFAAFCVPGRPDQDGRAGPGMVAVGRVRVDHDLAGSVYQEQLLHQELVKYPPTRLRADSMLSRRENWWWVARAIVGLDGDVEVRELPPRLTPDDAVLVREADAEGRAPRVDVVSARDWSTRAGDGVALLLPENCPPGSGEQAYAFGHRHSPDYERWERWHRSGPLTGRRLRVEHAAGAPAETVRPHGILGRFQSHRALARDCRAGVAELESRLGVSG
ncbi:MULTISPECIES: hypothetical protein [Actinoalloteichus]|uniref:Uncharacterized protein n=1 Tax=Actinoalloteichus fjordicus TaxID=1612552 RepID=A0AAC9LB94_9PSEU|nr:MULTISPECIES: hypothetical protein [Actinoalloteichus]APU14171.1 hypothetical protein UA74_10550 [Actinoalloteichus fjordicus]APU20117.1 hypothetical protein UA75_10520 [Actinoalloteichus sp. GBA129-24]